MQYYFGFLNNSRISPDGDRLMSREEWAPDHQAPTEHYQSLDECPDRCNERGVCRRSNTTHQTYCMCFGGWEGQSCQ